MFGIGIRMMITIRISRAARLMTYISIATLLFTIRSCQKEFKERESLSISRMSVWFCWPSSTVLAIILLPPYLRIIFGTGRYQPESYAIQHTYLVTLASYVATPRDEV